MGGFADMVDLDLRNFEKIINFLLHLIHFHLKKNEITSEELCNLYTYGTAFCNSRKTEAGDERWIA